MEEVERPPPPMEEGARSPPKEEDKSPLPLMDKPRKLREAEGPSEVAWR